jgi:hypothetical protein
MRQKQDQNLPGQTLNPTSLSQAPMAHGVVMPSPAGFGSPTPTALSVVAQTIFLLDWFHLFPVTFLSRHSRTTSCDLYCIFGFISKFLTFLSQELLARILTLLHIAWPPRPSFEFCVEATMSL